MYVFCIGNVPWAQEAREYSFMSPYCLPLNQATAAAHEIQHQPVSFLPQYMTRLRGHAWHWAASSTSIRRGWKELGRKACSYLSMHSDPINCVAYRTALWRVSTILKRFM